VTQAEFATLRAALDNKEYKFSAPARKYLEELVTEQKSGSSTYKVINGVNYDRKVLIFVKSVYIGIFLFRYWTKPII
jgi:hypothetical protein